MNLKKIRMEKGVTQAVVSSVLGITRSAYTNIENGNREADYNTLKKLSDYYNVSIDYLLGWEPHTEDKKKRAATGMLQITYSDGTVCKKSCTDKNLKALLAILSILEEGSVDAI